MQRIIEQHDEYLLIRRKFKDLFWDDVLMDDSLDMLTDQDPC
jgi:hypothetical protein